MIKAILIETKDSNIVQILKDTISYTTTKNIPGGKYLDIILIDTEAEIKKGDLIAKWSGGKYLVTIVDSFQYKLICSVWNETQYYKVISSFNPSHKVPQLSEQSIKLLIEWYNKNGSMPEKVNIHALGAKAGYVDISLPKDVEKMYTREQTIELLKRIYKFGWNGGYEEGYGKFESKFHDCNSVNKWIEENL